MSDPVKLPPPSQQRRPFGLVHTFLGLGFVGGIFLLMAGSQLEVRPPKPTDVAPPVIPQGTVWLAARRDPLTPLGEAVVITLGERSLAATTLSAFASQGVSTEDVVLRDPDQKVEVQPGAALPLESRASPGTLDIASDLVLLELPASESLAARPLSTAAKVGDPVWAGLHGQKGLKLVLGEIARISETELIVFAGDDLGVTIPGVPWFDAKGEVVGITAVGGSKEGAILVYGLPAARIEALFQASNSPKAR